jgi:hypothetical protein
LERLPIELGICPENLLEFRALQLTAMNSSRTQCQCKRDKTAFKKLESKIDKENMLNKKLDSLSQKELHVYLFVIAIKQSKNYKVKKPYR